MKKAFLAFAAAAALVLAGCEKQATQVAATVTVDASGLEADAPVPDSFKVTLSNTSTTEVYTAQTENNSATFTLTPGIYTVLVEGSATAEGNAYTYSGNGRMVAMADGAEGTITVTATKAAALIFKEVFYAGHYDWYFRDQYYEIYNNSDQTVYADGLCIADLDMYSYDGTPIEYDIPDAENYLFAQFVWQVPGDGDDYPVAPGESIVIAQWATNHATDDLGGEFGKDLSGAEFEGIEGESTLWNGTVITDNPAINMIKYAAAYPVPQWLTPVGGSGLVIFFPTEDMDGTALTYEVGSDSIYGAALAIPVSCIVDAINTCPDAASATLSNIPMNLDAGYVSCSANYCNESIVRKVAETKEDGRVVYQDTNNSLSDFEVSTEPQIRRGGAGTPSWNTWK